MAWLDFALIRAGRFRGLCIFDPGIPGGHRGGNAGLYFGRTRCWKRRFLRAPAAGDEACYSMPSFSSR
jgi:hypothetical protein